MWAGRLNKIYCSLLLMCMIMTYSNTRAQFEPSIVPETMMPGSSGTFHIHDVTNYSYSNLTFPDFTSDLYIATIGVGNTKLYYKRSRSGSPMSIIDEGIEIIPGGCYDAVILNNPDVAAGSAYQYCILVAHSGVGGTYLSFYEWQTTGLSLLFTHQISTNVAHNVSLDAHSLYAYTAVWQEFPSNEIWAMGGFTPQPAMYPLTSTPKRLYGFNGSTTETLGWRPDVAMTKLENPGTDVGRDALMLYYIFLDNNREHCYINGLSFESLMINPSPIGLFYEHEIPPMALFPGGLLLPGCDCGPFGTNILTQPRFFHSYLPKIDAPDNSDYSWAAIVQQLESQYASNCNKNRVFVRNEISGAYRFNGAAPGNIILNDGSLNGTTDMHYNYCDDFDLEMELLGEVRPTVAWSADAQLIYYGWAKTKINPTLGDHDFIAVVYNPDPGFPPDAVLSTNGNGYRIVDFDAALDPLHGGRCITFSRQNDASNDLFVVFDADSANLNWVECLYYKHVDWNTIPAIGYRGEGNNKDESCSDKLIQNYYPNPIKDKGLTLELNVLNMADDIEVNIYDITGRVLHNFKGKIEEINLHLSNIATNGAKSLWTVQVISHTSGKSESIRVSVQ